MPAAAQIFPSPFARPLLTLFLCLFPTYPHRARMGDGSASVRHHDPRSAAAVMAGTFQPRHYNTLEEEFLGQHILADLAAAMGASALVAPFVRYVCVCFVQVWLCLGVYVRPVGPRIILPPHYLPPTLFLLPVSSIKPSSKTKPALRPLNPPSSLPLPLSSETPSPSSAAPRSSWSGPSTVSPTSQPMS